MTEQKKRNSIGDLFNRESAPEKGVLVASSIAIGLAGGVFAGNEGKYFIEPTFLVV